VVIETTADEHPYDIHAPVEPSRARRLEARQFDGSLFATYAYDTDVHGWVNVEHPEMPAQSWRNLMGRATLLSWTLRALPVGR
jgi:hypothetical protein